ncbi:hypothetical protein VNO78_01913 [Psophocarpus tetragonolobus]|uniref:Uncharacterized protein n=1 Tax=Psophocarpus tetragonolobus TaxID=3891 RepID=A0AAN9XUV2_PSOTE
MVGCHFRDLNFDPPASLPLEVVSTIVLVSSFPLISIELSVCCSIAARGGNSSDCLRDIYNLFYIMSKLDKSFVLVLAKRIGLYRPLPKKFVPSISEGRRNHILIIGKTVMPSLMPPTPTVLSLMLHSMMCLWPPRTEFHAKESA